MENVQTPLPVAALRWRCDPATLGFATTETVPPLEAPVGQERGVTAIAFGLDLERPGYNLFVAGPTGSGRSTTVRGAVARVAAGRPVPPDWCYLYNFAEPAQPMALPLPTGTAPALAHELDEFVARCTREIPQLFESEQYQQRRAAVQQQFQDRREELLAQLRTFADHLGFVLQMTPMGIVGVPTLGTGKPLSAEAFELLPDDRKAEIRVKGEQLEGRIAEMFLQVHRLEREASEQIRALDRETMDTTAGRMLEGIRAKYTGQAAILQHLDAIQADLVEHLDEFRQPQGEGQQLPLLKMGGGYDRYRANVVVTNDPSNGAPVVFEPNPTYYNLLGRIDYRATFGAMSTDFTLIRPGALHRANGGFLILNARDVLINPFAWDGLKRALRNQELRMENMGEQLTSIPTTTLRPQPLALQVKVVLIGDLETYLLLYRLDEEFIKLFKVKAQFGPYMDRTPESIQAYASFISNQVRDCGLLPFSAEAVARVVEQGARLAEHQERLATRFDALAELLTEADYRARQAGATVVDGGHVDAALAARDRRVNLLEEELRRYITEGVVTIDTHAEVVGQVNGLAVTDLGDHAFALPSRITARVGLGSEGVVNIEREAKLSGPTHSKGVLILSGYLLGQYARDYPLALSARLAFEQVYSEIDGDSASSTELYALLSSLADVPIRQGIAVTGSVNQRGEVQAVGGVAHKIEGFFAVCQAQGLTGQQGVMIPATNVRHLMLRPDVVAAVERGEFNIWAVQTIDEGLELLTGMTAGARQPDGTYPPETLHARVQERLMAMARRLATFADGKTGAGGAALATAATARDGQTAS